MTLISSNMKLVASFFVFPDNFTLQFNTMEHYCDVSNVFNVLI